MLIINFAFGLLTSPLGAILEAWIIDWVVISYILELTVKRHSIKAIFDFRKKCIPIGAIVFGVFILEIPLSLIVVGAFGPVYTWPIYIMIVLMGITFFSATRFLMEKRNITKDLMRYYLQPGEDDTGLTIPKGGYFPIIEWTYMPKTPPAKYVEALKAYENNEPIYDPRSNPNSYYRQVKTKNDELTPTEIERRQSELKAELKAKKAQQKADLKAAGKSSLGEYFKRHMS